MNIQVRQYEIEISAPYTEGQILDAPSAYALNRTRARNIRNLALKELAKHFPETQIGGILGPDGRASLEARVKEIDQRYVFGPVPEARAKSGTLEAEALVIGREMAETAARRQGGEWTEECLAEAAAAFARSPEALMEAAHRLETRMLMGLEDL